jgi:hypothetical protein
MGGPQNQSVRGIKILITRPYPSRCTEEVIKVNVRKGKDRPRTGHESPEGGGRNIALIFL